jgi:hypothetical protein
MSGHRPRIEIPIVPRSTIQHRTSAAFPTLNPASFAILAAVCGS